MAPSRVPTTVTAVALWLSSLPASTLLPNVLGLPTMGFGNSATEDSEQNTSFNVVKLKIHGLVFHCCLCSDSSPDPGPGSRIPMLPGRLGERVLTGLQWPHTDFWDRGSNRAICTDFVSVVFDPATQSPPCRPDRGEIPLVRALSQRDTTSRALPVGARCRNSSRRRRSDRNSRRSTAEYSVAST